MKRVLITGANSYIGTNVEKWLLKEPDKYHVETLDMKDPNWMNFDFSKFDVVFHVAGIAHIKETKKNRDLYYKVNRDLAVETAKKAKDSGVSQFIFLSSMSVYGLSKGVITDETMPRPKDAYGKSKYEAEILINELETNDFIVTRVRPPMVYGPGSKGNFLKLIKLARKTFIFPKIENKRSMLYIDNLSNNIKYIIENNLNGVFFPQNSDFMCTSMIVKEVSRFLNKKIWFTRLLNVPIYISRTWVTPVNKLFSDSYYDINLSQEMLVHNITSNQDSIRKVLDR